MTLLILREEFVCLVVILFILGYTTIYMSPNDAVVEQDLEKVRDACDAYTDSPIILSIAMGYASGVYSPHYMDIYNKADEAMYVNKTEIKKKHRELCGR